VCKAEGLKIFHIMSNTKGLRVCYAYLYIVICYLDDVYILVLFAYELFPSCLSECD
jgi:hypothetical protein